jgi:hypothetical protein
MDDAQKNIYPPIDFNSDNELAPLLSAYVWRGGINSEIVYHHYADGTKKTVARYGAKKSGFTLEEAIEMMKDLVEYQTQLEAHGVPLPAIEKIAVEHDSREGNRAVLVKVSPWTGKEVRRIIQEANVETQLPLIEKLVRDMCAILKPLCAVRRSGWDVKVGIDPRCTNFTVDPQGQMWFVDLFPPRYHKEQGRIVEWPEPQSELGKQLGAFKHFDVRGIILCTTAQLARIKPELKDFFEKIVVEEMKDIMTVAEYEEFVAELKETPWMRLRTLLATRVPLDSKHYTEAVEIITTAAQKEVFGVRYSIYTLRELALELAFAGVLSQDELDWFFKNSHFEDELPGEVIKNLERWLCERLQKIQ